VSDASSESRSSYRLDELGWLQFDRLCDLVLVAHVRSADLQWRGQSDTWRTAVVESPMVLGDPTVRLAGPVTVAAVWIPGDRPEVARWAELAGRMVALLDEWEVPVEHELLVLTNLDGERAGAALRGMARRRNQRFVLMGGSQIAGCVDRHPEIRAALPSVLGLRDLRSLIDSDALVRSSLDIERAQELARVFWPTRAYDRARVALAAHRFVVLTGPPEMGKTAIAQMLALAQMTDGWQAHECTEPEQVWRVFDRDCRQVFVADDAFGSTEYRPDSAEHWALGLGRLLGMLDQNHWLIWTSRPAPLKAGLRRLQRERGSEHFPDPGRVLVDAGDLDLEEKTLILFRHAKAHDVDGPARDLLRTGGISLVEHPHFTPERIRRFVLHRVDELPETTGGDEGQLRAIIERELTLPTQAMRDSFASLTPEHRDLLIALLDAPAGLIDERELTAAVRRHHGGGLSRLPGDLIDRLSDHFLRVTPLGIGWVHPSWRDLVIDELREHAPARQRFLSACRVDGVMLALSHQGGAIGERQLPLLQSDRDWDRLADRLYELLADLEPREVARVLLALEDALADEMDAGQRREAQSLAALVLATTQQGWDRDHRPLPGFLLDAWYRLRHLAPGPITAPQLLSTWTELHPGSALLERPDLEALLRADEWLALAQVLHQHDPDALDRFGFDVGDRHLLELLIAQLDRAAELDEPTRAVAQSVLTRIPSLIGSLTAIARYVMETAGLAESGPQQRWWVPHDISAPPSRERIADRDDFTRRDVRRVLNDL
jgi:hypothetical protein